MKIPMLVLLTIIVANAPNFILTLLYEMPLVNSWVDFVIITPFALVAFAITYRMLTGYGFVSIVVGSVLGMLAETLDFAVYDMFFFGSPEVYFGPESIPWLAGTVLAFAFVSYIVCRRRPRSTTKALPQSAKYTRYCGRCGAKIGPEDRFCTECGEVPPNEI